MPAELYYLALVSLLTALLWVPYGLHLIGAQGLSVAFGNRHDVRPFSPWAERAKRAHENAVQGLVVFAAVVLAAHAAGVANSVTVAAACLYFWARLAHYVVYVAGIIVVRTVVWTIAWICQLVIAWQVIAS